MSKGTPSKGKQSGKKTHIRCPRCGGHSFHMRKKFCSSCGYGRSSKIREYKWMRNKK